MRQVIYKRLRLPKTCTLNQLVAKLSHLSENMCLSHGPVAVSPHFSHTGTTGHGHHLLLLTQEKGKRVNKIHEWVIYNMTLIRMLYCVLYVDISQSVLELVVQVV